jgi:hypothetical protein
VPSFATQGSPHGAISPQADANVTSSAALVELQKDFEEAASAAGGAIERSFTIAGAAVHARFGGQTAAELLTPAFAHLEADERPPALTLHVWDSANGRTRRPAFAFAPSGRGVAPDAGGPGASYFYEQADFQALYQPAPDVLSVFSARAGAAWFWTPDVRRLPHWEYAAPFRDLLSWWLGTRGYQHVHGGAVGRPRGGILIAGRGGSGKSTTALASLLDARLRYAGDDYVALGGGASPAVHSLYCSGKVHRADLERLPHLREAVANADRLDDEKAVLYVPRAFPGRAIGGFPLRAIVMPRVTERRRPLIAPATHAAALSALAPSTILQRRPPQRGTLSAIARVVEQVPAFVLELGSDISRVPGAVLELLDQLPES